MKIAITKVEKEVPVTIESLEKQLEEMKSGISYSMSCNLQERRTALVPMEVLNAINSYEGDHLAFVYEDASDEIEGRIIAVQSVYIPR